MRAHNFLWVMGLFLFWDIGFNVLSYSVGGNQTVAGFKSINGLQSILLLLGVFAVLVLLLFFFRSKAAIIWGTKELMEKKRPDFYSAWAVSRRFYARVFGVWFSTIFLLVLASVILAAPVAYLVSINFSSRAAVLGVLALIIFIPVAFVANLINNLAPIFMVFYDFKINQAVAAAMDLIRKFWLLMIVFCLWMGLITAAATYAILGAWRLGVVFLGKLFYNAVGFHLTFGNGIVLVIGAAAFLFFAGYVACFQQVCWTILVSEIAGPQKTEEAETLPVPEVI